jgi:hypothetical protein
MQPLVEESKLSWYFKTDISRIGPPFKFEFIWIHYKLENTLQVA